MQCFYVAHRSNFTVHFLKIIKSEPEKQLMLMREIKNMLFVKTQEPKLIAKIEGVFVDTHTNKTLILQELLKPSKTINVQQTCKHVL